MAAKPKAVPKAQSGAAKIEAAVKLLNAAKADKAATLLSEAITSGRLRISDMARALHYRAIAQRKRGLPARAIADFTSALWLKGGLPASLRADAKQQLSAAYREAGLAGAPSGRTAATAPSVNWQTRTTAQGTPAAVAPAKPQSSSGGGIGGFFSNLFGGGAATKPAARPPKIAPPPQATGRPVQTAKASGWSNVTAVNRAAESANPPRPAAPKPTARLKGAYRLLLSPVRSEAAAKALALKVKQQFAEALDRREAVVEQTVLGSMGTFYRVAIGPFAETLAPQSICTKLIASGHDCILVAR